MLTSRNLQILILVSILTASSAGGWAILKKANEIAESRANGPFSPARIAADKAFKARDYSTATGYFRALAREDPYNCWAQMYLGRSLLQVILEDNPNPTDASSSQVPDPESADQAGSGEPDYRDAWFAEAHAALRAGSELKILRTASNYHIARLYYQQKNFDAAIEILARLPPGETRFQRSMATDFSEMGDREDFKPILAAQQATNRP